ncbi:MAG: heme ABC transporter permease [Alphaproteobacteria bacterium]|nr:heme ABC transporter permease [Alphaproteobacteria bacterium]
MHRFANPNRFLRIAALILPWSAAITVTLLVVGLYLALKVSPADYQQGESVRIMYVHVPAAWMALFVYSCLAGASAIALIWKHPLANLAAKASAPIGACFTFIALTTGAIWGKPIWDAWWVWDARLTSVLILFFFYMGHMALTSAFEDASRGERAAAILALVGFINIPVIKWSVNWWNTLHQPASIVRLDGPAIHASMLAPLLIMAASFATYYVSVLILRLRSEILARKMDALRLTRVRDSQEAHSL